jgi:hypothetical protein
LLSAGGSVKKDPPTRAIGCRNRAFRWRWQKCHHFCQFGCLGRRQQPSADGRGNRLHRDGEIGRLAHWRQRQRHQPLAMWRDQAVETEPQRGRVATKGEFDGFAGQGFGLALQQQLGGQGRFVATPARAASGVAGTPLLEWAAPLFLLFLQEIISDH